MDEKGSDRVERVARAMYECDPRSSWWAEWDELPASDPTRRLFMNYAHAAVEAMLRRTEMSDAMAFEAGRGV